MGGQSGLEVYRQHVVALQKYTYFLLAAVGACVGFALTQTNEAELSVMQIPLALALTGWGLSFWWGCAHLKLVQATLYTNAGLIRLQSGKDPVAGRNAALMMQGDSVIREIGEDQSQRAVRASSRQFWWFIFGVIAYIVWHVLAMWSRTLF